MSSKSYLRILVPVKRAIDYQIRPRLVDGTINTKGIKFSINPFDDIAVEEALRIKESHNDKVENVHCVSIGQNKAQDIIRNCLAKGVDSSTLIDSGDASLEPLAIAKLLKKMVEKSNSNLIILGKQAIDDDSSNTGQILAGLLNWPQATNAAKVELLEGDKIKVTREIDGGEEYLVSSLPMVITTDLRLNTPRYVSLSKLMKAKKLPIEKLGLDHELFKDVDTGSQLKVIKLEEPKPRDAGIQVDSVAELITKIRADKLI
ncbi:hypothetical protein TPHA_0J03220 [Tetrapisispora phaffii CBS 4417]|uniref:Probable electron transfer flavoprotein subunit beta n=1 Tax=Tetrapisispora phaffii (strain ATCC 24235 / CBS 4417 / NBRC 1672 / NRRL Y-8282 / UCD 70-5) TaxID=1071381 RepID=G8BY90_TETPH|nr:hypothetical protein TPHA_0J03220 [Tetrapisispora phaffii CBS 4417]CCE65141.1 hypothetical protein TPHA_0J03220 [Tetrapisispora phaffii CBS 4417]